MLAHVGKFDVHAATQPRTQVRWAGEDITEVLIPHKSVTLVLKQLLDLKAHGFYESVKWVYALLLPGNCVLQFMYETTLHPPPKKGTAYLCKACTETSEDLLHVAPFLHGDDTQVILLIHPHQECLVVVVPDKHSVRMLILMQNKAFLSGTKIRRKKYQNCFTLSHAVE